MVDQEQTMIKDIARVFIFEHWARFYFAVDRDGKTFLEVPEDVMEECRKDEADLVPLLEKTNNQELTYESSCQNVGAFVCGLLDGSKYPPGKVTQALDSKPYRIEMHLFSLWLQGHEGYLEQKRLPFAEWLDMFANWKRMDQVQAFIAKLEQSGGADSKAVH